MRKLLVYLIKLYQRFVSPCFPPTCRFYPTCSTYAIQAINQYGAIRGVLIAVKRIIKCHPFHPGGYDPVK